MGKLRSYKFKELVSQCSYPGFEFLIKRKGSQHTGGGFLVPETRAMYVLQIQCTTGEKPWRGRKWDLSAHMTDSEVVMTAFKAVLTALEHEAREHFRFMGLRPFNPHFNVYDLIDLDQNKRYDVRPDNGSMLPE